MTQPHLFQNIPFDNGFVRALPGDPETANTRRQVPGACYSRVMPRSPSAPRLIALSHPAARVMGLDPRALAEHPDVVAVLSGQSALPEMDPFAMNYGGHQFGHWAGQLGDGRAIVLGEMLSPDQGRWVLQLKGAGPTPYSRTADGLAVLRSSIREFLCSEAMHHLGIPTTRALSLVLTGDEVERDMFYDGHPKLEPGAVVCRTAPSFIRFGHFELPASRGEEALVRQLMDYTIATDFPQLDPQDPRVYLNWFNTICRTTCQLMIHWMRVGFVHGVMNTDNLSILGQTIDYGPYGWLEEYDPGWTPNTTDARTRRYTFGNQPDVALWNLARLAQAIHPVTGDEDGLNQCLADYAQEFKRDWEIMMGEKLGFFDLKPLPGEISELIQELQAVLVEAHADFTLFFRTLGDQLDDPRALATALEATLYLDTDGKLPPALGAWLKDYHRLIERHAMDPKQRRRRMAGVNPKYVLRNYLAQEAIDLAEAGDYSRVHTLLKLMERPYQDQAGMEQFAQKRPEWARHRPGCSMLSCSS